MFYVYIIYSHTTDHIYVGSTADVDERIKKHNRKHKGFTGAAKDWEIVYKKISYKTKVFYPSLFGIFIIFT